MNRSLFFTLAFFVSLNTFAQTQVKRVLILNEGYFDYISGSIVTPVSLGSYDPETGIYGEVDEIEGARFASDIEIYGGNYFVAADKYLMKYDLYTDELLNTIEVQGIRKIAVDDNYIVVTRGEYLVSLSSYIQVYDKNTLALIFEVPAADMPYATEGVLIRDGIAYVAVNNGFDFGNEVGLIEKIDLAAHAVISETDLGPDGKNPDNLMIDGDNIYTLNNKDYTGSSVSAYKISDGAVTTSNLLNISAGCGTSAFFSGNIYYQESYGTSLSKYEPLSNTLVSETDYDLSFYGMAFDEINELLYVSETDFFSKGRIHVYNMEGDEVNRFKVGISPGNIAFDMRTTVDIADETATSVNVWPNPSADFIHIALPEISQITLTDITGNIMQQYGETAAGDMDINISSYPAGNYFVSVTSASGTGNKMIVKL